MIESLLHTKLFIPSPPPGLVPRQRLLARLAQGMAGQGRLTLIAAPAGAGKSTLLSAWIPMESRPTAWVTLDSGDRDPRRFLAYVMAALQTVPTAAADGFGAHTLAKLNAPQPLPLESILVALVNEIAAMPDPFLLVLDDYHTLDTAEVDSVLAFLLDNQPPTMHLVISSREDPNLPLARLRAQGKLTEIRAADLRFSLEETALFLNDFMHLDLSPGEINALERRTEGWAAGLQMAAIALQATPDAQHDRHAFIDAFTGSHRFVLDYLLEEVLQRQPPSLRHFLLCTSILDQLTGPLCDAVLGEDGSGNGRQRLQTLESSNLFLVALDNRRQWYRYHHLFADVLQAHLHNQPSLDVAELHRRASAWFAAHDAPSAAIRHSLAAADFSRAAELISAAWPEMDRSFQSSAWLTWADQLPDALVQDDPHLSAQYAWALIDNGKLDAANARLHAAEAWLAHHSDHTAIDGSLRATILVARAQLALARGDVDAAADYAQQGHRLAVNDPLRRAQAKALQGIANWNRGNLEAAYQAMSGWISSMMQADNLYFAVASTFVLADLRQAQGRLHDAVHIYRHSLAQSAVEERALRPVLSHHYLGLARLYHEMNQIAQADEAWRQAKDVGKQSALIDWPYRWQRALAQPKITAGEWEAALELLDEAERQYVPNPVPDTEPIGALRARIYLRQGRLSAARAWVQSQAIAADDPPTYLQEYAHLTLVRVLLAEHAEHGDDTGLISAKALLHRLLSAAEAGGRLGRVIEIHMLQALAAQAEGKRAEALGRFERALRLAQPAGYFRLFTDEDARLIPLLQAALTAQILPSYTAEMLAAMGTAERSTPAPQPLIDPLSPREMEVLSLFQTELSGPQIADELVVALSTVRSHTKQIYSKLGVSSRRAAVNRAVDLGLLNR